MHLTTVFVPQIHSFRKASNLSDEFWHTKMLKMSVVFPQTLMQSTEEISFLILFKGMDGPTPPPHSRLMLETVLHEASPL
jgi:hypothetical protein